MKLVLMFFLLLVVLSPHAYAYDTAVGRHWPQLSCPTFEERRLSLKLIKTFPRVAPRSPFPPRSVDVQSSNNASFQRFQLVSREITTTKTMPNTLRIRSRPLNTPFVYRFCLETFLDALRYGDLYWDYATNQLHLSGRFQNSANFISD